MDENNDKEESECEICGKKTDELFYLERDWGIMVCARCYAEAENDDE